MQGLLQPILPPGVAADPHAYRQAIWTIAYSTFFKSEIFFIMLLVVVAGPNLISRDLRFNALPLYFSRPLTRLDYFLGKLGVIAALVAAVAVVPAVAAYVLGVCFSLDLGVIRDTWRLLPASILYGLVIVVSAGTLMLALSSLSRRSLYVGIAWVGLWVISSAVAGVLAAFSTRPCSTAPGRKSGRRKWLRPVRHVAARWAPADPDEARPRSSAGANVRGAAWQRAQQRTEQAEAEAAPTNWRPLCSYTANLAAPGRGAAEHRRRLGRDRPGHRGAAGRLAAVVRRGRGGMAAKRRPPTSAAWPIRWCRSIRGYGRPACWPACWDFRYGLEHAREIAGPAAVTPVVEFDGVSKWYGNVIGLNKLTRADSARRHGAARPQRGGQVDLAATGHRTAPAQPGAACACSGTGPGTTRR